MCIYQHPPAICQPFERSTNSVLTQRPDRRLNPKTLAADHFNAHVPLFPVWVCIGDTVDAINGRRGQAQSRKDSLLRIELLITGVGHFEFLWQVDPELQTIRVLGTFDMQWNLGMNHTLPNWSTPFTTLNILGIPCRRSSTGHHRYVSHLCVLHYLRAGMHLRSSAHDGQNNRA